MKINETLVKQVQDREACILFVGGTDSSKKLNQLAEHIFNDGQMFLGETGFYWLSRYNRWMFTGIQPETRKSIPLKDFFVEEVEEKKCPDCDGTGIVTGTGYNTECCGMVNGDGTCCTRFIQIPHPVPEQCERCQATGVLLSHPEPVDKVEGEIDWKAKYEKCIAVIKKFDPGIIGMYDL